MLAHLVDITISIKVDPQAALGEHAVVSIAPNTTAATTLPLSRLVNDRLADRKERDLREFQVLDAERNADDRHEAGDRRQ